MNINVNVGLDITDETLAQILYLLEIWQNNNPDKFIFGEDVIKEDGRRTVFKVGQKKPGEGEAE